MIGPSPDDNSKKRWAAVGRGADDSALTVKEQRLEPSVNSS
jgi:hypothetical protein